MFDDVNSTLHHRVLSAYERYRDERNSCRIGSNKLLDAAVDLAVALHHFPEHLPPSFRIEGSTPNADLLFISEVSNAAKHSERKWGVQRFLTKADALSEVAFSTKYLDETGSYEHCEVRVVVACLDGIERDLDGPLIGSLNFWIAHLASLGVTRPLELKPAILPGTVFVERTTAQALSIVVHRQTDAKIMLRCQNFNPITLVPDPMDLTGFDGRLRVYQRPLMELVIKLSHQRLSEDLEACIRLTTQEADDLEAASLLGLREGMIEQLALRHKAELESQLAEAIAGLDENKPKT